ncbi:MAG: mevalonate kinase [Candidatus Nitrosotenuis sp.]|nr:mevalonate kinase [Candidatus Nitrosotenuis sp.]
MKSIASAPGKIILFGEHFIVYGGRAILCSIDRHITVESELTDTGKIEIRSDLGQATILRDDPMDRVDQVLRPIAFVAQRMLREFNSGSGMRVVVTAGFPAGVGLGSSSACCVAAAGSISGLFTQYTKEEILKIAIDAERTIFENTSGADCSVCTFGGIIEYHRHGEINRIDADAMLQFVVANSKMTHSTSEVVSRVRRYKENNPAIFSLLCRQEESLIEDALDAIRQNDLRGVGQKMSQNQKFLEQIGVSNETLDSMVSLASRTAYGSKITGAGDGGCTISLVDEANIGSTVMALGANYECFATKIDTVGLRQKKE